MSRLSPEQIAQVAHDAGFRGQDLTIAVAVALAESGGDPRAHNGTPPDNSYGLWQINMIGSLGPARRDQFDLDANRELFDPKVNARAANAISGDGRSWTPWTTYTSGRYRQFLDEARRGVRALRSGNGATDGPRPGGQGGGSTGGPRPGGSGSGGSGSGSSGGGSGPGSFSVDTHLLDAYVRRARGVADDLTAVGTTHVRRVRQIADDSFGKIGKETGFAAALDGFAAALHRQVRGVGANADTLAKATSRTSRQYRDQDDDIAGTLGRM